MQCSHQPRREAHWWGSWWDDEGCKGQQGRHACLCRLCQHHDGWPIRLCTWRSDERETRESRNKLKKQIKFRIFVYSFPDHFSKFVCAFITSLSCWLFIQHSFFDQSTGCNSILLLCVCVCCEDTNPIMTKGWLDSWLGECIVVFFFFLFFFVDFDFDDFDWDNIYCGVTNFTRAS